MANTTFSGPVISQNGFVGPVTATTGTTTLNNVEITGNAGIGNAGTDTIGFYGATKIARPTTAVAAATFAANTSGIADDTATFDGYTIGQVVKALRNLGLLA